MRRLLAASLASILTVLVLAGCGPSHRLGDVAIESRTVAVMAAIPPGPRVVSGPWPFVDRMIDPPPGEARRRYDAARAAQARLDSAAAFVDVAEIIARHALLESGRALQFRPAGDPETSDYILDVRLLDFGFQAETFEHLVRFYAEADVVLSERASGEVVWQRRIRERDAVRSDDFGLEETIRITPRVMTQLNQPALEFGLERLATFTANRVAQTLARDYARAHHRGR